ncbi:uncharacterized protein PHACADRAFT_184465 [Phanerochaete carnosa HHB-10118-sp]|uniref:Carboxylesterase type B domain-containing protein n=1 Tax=Phanerochaete carnosa (strain HHB-10118-sp) TaxID=650164 RepID=K5W9N3_PHACS|nr:uncharacterized protein PHACADRAFT_184465 [Phanerochaete carnosa HHB-10118-sp]EKM55684.1 hypothetical protein PHACADRAFT_184465 [Phanerochaete carnosa HHB-10118-sp]
MVFFGSLLSALSLASAVVASPVNTSLHTDPFFPPVPVTAKGLFCSLPIPIVQQLLCPRQGSSNPTVKTPLGTAQGIADADNAARFAVRYGQAARWQPSTVVSSWQFPYVNYHKGLALTPTDACISAGNTNASQLPLACPQDGIDASAMSEDCLSMLLYVPSSVNPASNAPTLLWIHGGSFIQGSATNPGLDGSNLAAATNSIVAVVQYRLGALGLVSPNGQMNLAGKDIVTAMQFLQKVLPSFGGSPSKITLAGQSSGANMIRGLLATPSAQSLFQSAILQSDPMDYGFLSAGTQKTLQDFFVSQLSCSASDTACLNNLSIGNILTAQDNLMNNALGLDPSTGSGEPIRLLGLVSPNGQMNLAGKDIVTAMQFLQKVLPSFGGSPSKITLAGQSSGANMIRGLLATPSAQSLFQSAILQSDPMDYGFLSTGTQKTLQDFFVSQLSCSASDTACLNNLSIGTILTAQDNLMNNALGLDPSTGSGEPIRLVRDGSFITSPLDSTAPFPSVSKPILVTNVRNEAALSIYGGIPAIGVADYEELVEETFGTGATQAILKNTDYAVATLGAVGGGADIATTADERPTLEKLGTDQIWRCPTWTFARNWAAHGGAAYVGMYVVGASYPGNIETTSFCGDAGIVCHQDDIEIVFGTAPSPDAQQSALISEMQARYKAFFNTGNPNVAGHATWTVAGTSDVHALTLGGSGEVAAGGCDPSFFGAVVPYDYQVFDI